MNIIISIMRRLLIIICIFSSSIYIFGQEDILFTNRGYINFQHQDYNIFIALVEDLQKTMDIWNVPGVTPNINTTTTAKLNEKISIFIVYATDKDNINLTYNLRMRRPNGTFSENTHSDGLIISNTVKSKRILYIASQLPTIVFDEKDEIGEYYFVVEVNDNNNLIKTFILEFNLLE